MSEALLQIRNLTKSYNRNPVLKGVDLDICKGEAVALLGESGSGKSTLARVLVKLIHPCSGSLTYEGREIFLLPEWPRKCQIVFQNPYSSLNPRMTVAQIISEPLSIHRMGTRRSRMKRVSELLDLVGLSKDMAGRFPQQFSGGQKQRIAIARALSIEPEFLICDEALSSLDSDNQLQILELLKTLRQELSFTCLFITHDVEVARVFCSREVVLVDGKLAAAKR